MLGSRKQSIAAQSTRVSEYLSANETTKESAWRGVLMGRSGNLIIGVAETN
jgi:hypothetical protein